MLKMVASRPETPKGDDVFKAIFSAAIMGASMTAAGAIHYEGGMLGYPKNITPDRLAAEIPDFKCIRHKDDPNFQICSAEVTLLQPMLIVGYAPMVCKIGGDVSLFFRDGKVQSTSCDVTSQTWSDLFLFFQQKYGAPSVEKTNAGTIKSATYQWRDGSEFVRLFIMGGENVKGEPFITKRFVIGPFKRTGK